MTQRFAFCPWRFRQEASPQEREQQRAFREQLDATRRFALPDDDVSPLAGLAVARLEIGYRSRNGGLAYLWHDAATGAACTVHPFAVFRGGVGSGYGVCIPSHASVIAFNQPSLRAAP